MRVTRPQLPIHWQAEARAIGRRTGQTFLLATLTGVLVGLAVVVIETVTVDGLLDLLVERPLWFQALAPAVGLGVAALFLRWVAGSEARDTADEYIRSFHDPGPERLDPRPVIGRVLASVATIGYGGALGLEGPSIYVGSTIGSGLQRRFSRHFSREDAKVLLVAGAAAGVAAIFKAPATGALFAIEVPYRADVARRNVLPAMVAAAAGYITSAVFFGTDPILPVSGAPPFDWRDIGGALLVGVLCGVGARLFSAAIRAMRTLPRIVDTPWPARIAAAGGALAVLAVVSDMAADQPLTLGPGYDVIMWATDPAHGAWLVLLVLVLRVGAVFATYGGGGVGGLFIPLVVTGALTGRLTGDVVGLHTDLLVVVGMAAFLGAGYRTPLAALMFVAETTGRPGFVVPALVATAASQLVVGDASVASHQRAGRLGHLERRFELPISAVMATDVRTVPPDATVEEFLSVHLVGHRRRSVPVVDETSRYLGMAVLDEVVAIRREAWASTDIRRIARVSGPCGRTTWLVRDAVEAMERGDTDVLAIVDGDDRFVGVVTTEDVLRLDEILERTGMR